MDGRAGGGGLVVGGLRGCGAGCMHAQQGGSGGCQPAKAAPWQQLLTRGWLNAAGVA